MKPAPYDYVRPRDLDAAVALVSRGGGAAKIVAGGQSLGPMLNLRLVEPALVVDVAALAALRRAAIEDGDLVLGACVTHADIEDGRVPDVTRGAMRGVAGSIAFRAVRNRGTVGGSLSHADPAADWVSALTALDARVVLRGEADARTVPMAEFVTGAFETALGPGEILAAVRIPPLPPGARWGYAKACRKAGEFAHAIAAVVLDPGRGSRAVIGAVDGRPLILDGVPGLCGGGWDPGAACAALERAGIADPVDRHIHTAVLGRAVREAAS